MLGRTGPPQGNQHAAGGATPRPHARPGSFGAAPTRPAPLQTRTATRARLARPPPAPPTPAAAGPSAGALADGPAAAPPPPPPARPQPKAGKQKQPPAPPRGVPEGISIRPVSGQLEAKQVARLRAEAYYADERSRFAESFKRQFASQEAESLAARTARRAGARAPACDCLVALDAAGGTVVGCIDIRVPQAASGLPAAGVPDSEPGGAYILNVVVDAPARRRGVGRALMRAAMARAVAVWGAGRLFTHVEADNEVAGRLYRSCGFAEHSDTAAYEGASVLGRLVLLVAGVDQVDTSYPCGDAPAGNSGGAAA